ncbi:unnamed protein product (macronuclear) [Paramecium tetraurelia]|uniref:Uncharacterized protein n=1 Tax=Paramecium tetraurelia TaxID=5888 RepID=A0C4T7_PARTE|nr:uncharacterized protein GSPATT00006303001 [Paramecium tetraurelia]CAK65804.1 unnamed protein product [Paramecium tetraurelia]|eukprot:XP_001433201.1 hypothetical protein (macronuclear) [Paramecium tetraurelia strain d4-2]
MLYSIRETDAEANLSLDSQTGRKSLNSDVQKKSYSRSLPKQQHNLDQEIQKLNDIIVQLRKVEQLLLNQVKDLKHQLEEQFKNSNRNQKYIDELNKELQQMSDKLHSEIMHNGQLQKINIELKKTILKLEQEICLKNCKFQSTIILRKIQIFPRTQIYRISFAYGGQLPSRQFISRTTFTQIDLEVAQVDTC